MSKGNCWLFSGTSKANSDTSKKALPKATSYRSTSTLRKHIESAEPTKSGKEGIKGAHHKDNFIEEANRIGAKITETTPHSQMDGIEIIAYKMPMKDGKGNLTGGFKSKTLYKTVYNPSIVSTDQYLKQGLQAAKNASKSSTTGKLGREWTGTDNEGVKWRGYCDNYGNITSFFPEN